MLKYLCIVLFMLYTSLYSNQGNLSNFERQKLEIKELKKELNSFYNKKEKEYKDRKNELKKILAQIEKEKAEIKDLHDNNLSLLQDIKNTVESKTARIYNKMKPKVAASIFNEMISEGKIEDVFDIVLRLKEKNVTLLMKSLSVANAAKLTEMLKNYNVTKE